MDKSDVTIYLVTRNRNFILPKIMKNLKKYCDGCKILISNCSSENFIDETTEIINRKEFSSMNVEEVKYEKDPGLLVVYADMFFEKIQTELGIVWSDDTFFIRDFSSVIRSFSDSKIVLGALPMIDDISYAPSIPNAWPKDKFGCAIWDTPTGRCSNHTIERVSYYRAFPRGLMEASTVDGFFHNYSSESMRHFPDDGAYMVHYRMDDYTRANTIMKEDEFRFSTGHSCRQDYDVKDLKDREKKVALPSSKQLEEWKFDYERYEK